MSSQIEKDLARLAMERLHKFVADMIAVHEMADLEQRVATETIVYTLLMTAAKVSVWDGSMASPPPKKMGELFCRMFEIARENKQANGSQE